MKKKLKKVKGEGYKNRHFKNDQTISERYKLSAQATTLPFKNLTLGKIFSKNSSQMPPNPLQGGGGVWECDKSQFLESRNILY